MKEPATCNTSHCRGTHTHLMLCEELAVGGQVGGSDRRRDGVVVLLRRRRCFVAGLRTRGEHRGDDVLAEALGDEVHGRAAAVPVEDTVECLR